MNKCQGKCMPAARKRLFMRSALFWVVTQRVEIFSYRRFGTKYRSHPHGSRIQLLNPDDETDRLPWNVGEVLR
jgi:hypothetical protein